LSLNFLFPVKPIRWFDGIFFDKTPEKSSNLTAEEPFKLLPRRAFQNIINDKHCFF